MDLWGPRRTTSLREARWRTGLVHILRLLFTVAAMVSAGFLLGPVIDHAFNSARKGAYPTGSSSVTVLKPEFKDKDSNGRPYVITSDTARARRENKNLVDLVNPHMQDATDSHVRAETGVYNQAEQVLDLVGNVVMTNAAGYTFTTDKARMFVKENRVEGQTPLVGRGPMGEVRGNAYEVTDNGNRIRLTGRVETLIKSKRRSGRSGAPQQADNGGSP